MKMKHLVVIAAVAGVGVMASGATGADSDATSREGDPVKAEATRSQFAVFSAPAARAVPAAKLDKLDAVLRRTVDHGVVRDDGTPLRRDSARVVRQSGDGMTYVATNSREVCLATEDRDGRPLSLSCAIVEGEEQQPIVSVDPVSDSEAMVTALVVDGVSDVELETATGARRRLEVRNSTAQATPTRPKKLSWTNRDGTRGQIQFPTPR